ncbi:MAG: hypothetical protein V3T07_09835 [Myxococcota bacterium]
MTTAESVWESRWARRGARVVLPGLAFAIACGPLLRDGFPRGHDWIYELVRVAEYQAALVAGQLPPAWAENLYAGYGSPVFLFYPPLFSAAASPLAWVLGSVAAGATLLLVLLTAASVWTARGFFERACTGGTAPSSARLAAAAARVGVYVYVLHPYLLGDKLLRNASAEFAALCLVPLALEGVLRAGTRPRRAFIQVSLGLSLAILSHNLTALVAVSLVLGAGLVVHPPGRSRATWGLLAAAIAFALVLTAFFWLPAVSLTSLVRSQDLLVGKFDFHRQFPGFFEVFGYDRFFATGLVTPAVWLIAGVAVFRLGNDPRRRLLVAGLGAGFGFWFLLTRASTFIWEHVPLLPFFQFPWRMIGPLALMTALSAALAFAGLLAHSSRRVRIGAELVIFGLCVLNALPVLGQARPIAPEMRARLSEVLAPESIRSGSQSVTVGDEYLPRAANPAAWKSQRPQNGPVVSVVGDAEIAVIRNNGTWIELEVTADEVVRLRLARWAFPGWRLERSGVVVPWQANRDGSIDVVVPAGETRLELRYQAPRVRRIALGVSGLALLVWIGLVSSRRLPSIRGG